MSETTESAEEAESRQQGQEDERPATDRWTLLVNESTDAEQAMWASTLMAMVNDESAGDPVWYLRGSALAELRSSGDAPKPMPVSKERFNVALSATGRVRREAGTGNNRRQVGAMLPASLMHKALAHEYIAKLPRIESSFKHPVLTEFGMVSEPGYHPASRIYIEDGGDCSMGKTEALSAIEDLLQEVKFRDASADKAAAVAAMATPYLRPMIREKNIPFFLVHKDNQTGAGASYLCKMIAATSRVEITETTWKKDNDEQAKAIGAWLEKDPDQMVLLDNVDKTTFASDPLEALITGHGTWEDRRLGSSTMLGGSHSLTIFGTSNTYRASGGMKRRIWPIGLTHPEPSDSERAASWKNSPVADLLEPGGADLIVSALASLVKQWNEAGRPGLPDSHRPEKMLGLGGDWRDVVGGFVVWCGYHGFEHQVAEWVEDELVEETGEPLAQLMSRLYVDYKVPFTAADAHKSVADGTPIWGLWPARSSNKPDQIKGISLRLSRAAKSGKPYRISEGKAVVVKTKDRDPSGNRPAEYKINLVVRDSTQKLPFEDEPQADQPPPKEPGQATFGDEPRQEECPDWCSLGRDHTGECKGEF